MAFEAAVLEGAVRQVRDAMVALAAELKVGMESGWRRE